MNSDDRVPDADRITLPSLPKWVGKITNHLKTAPTVDMATVMIGVLVLGIAVFIVLVATSAMADSLDHGKTGTSESSQFDTRNDR